MTDEPLLWAVTLACLGLAGGALTPLPSRHRLALLSAALLLAPPLVLADNWETERVRELRESVPLLLAAITGAVVAVALGARAFLARPRLLPLALVATMAFRVPVELAGSTANLLLPLYAVLAAGVLAAWLRPARLLERELPRSGPGALVGWTLAAFLVLYGLQAAYADDLSQAIENAGFFLVPFTALLVLLASFRWDGGLARGAALVLVAEMALVSLVGFGQYIAGDVFWNEKVMAGNEAHVWFRVNSLFFDPNIMGRYLAVTMVLLGAAVAWGARPLAKGAAALFGLMLAALAITFSQSSFLALIAGLLALGLARWGATRAAAAAAATLAALAISFAAASGAGALDEETTGRTSLVSGGLELAAERPLLGHGAGSFPDEFERRFGAGEGFSAVSHTEPVTVAVEQGLVGLLPYAALVALGLVGLARAGGIGRGAAPDPWAVAILAAFVAMVVHSIGYAAFFSDPITWALLAFAVAPIGASGPRGPSGRAGRRAEPPAAERAGVQAARR